MSPFPEQLLPFLPIDRSDNRYGQLYSPIQKEPYLNAGIRGFTPFQPHKENAIALLSVQPPFHFPSLAKLNPGMTDWTPGEEDSILGDPDLCANIEVFRSLPVQP